MNFGGQKAPTVKIAVVGVGGCGGHAIELMCQKGEEDKDSVFNSEHIRIIAANTDVQDLYAIPDKAEKLQLGANKTAGKGAGGDPEIGRESAEESQAAIAASLDGFDMVFVTAGMGGGTGTGAAPVIAKIAKDAGILTVGIVTEPFSFEGKDKYAKTGIENLMASVDSLITIPNERLLDLDDEDSDIEAMFNKTNDILLDALSNISSMILIKGKMNIDFADVTAVMKDLGKTMIVSGTAHGEDAPLNSVHDALNNALLQDFTITGTKRMLAYFYGSKLKLAEMNRACTFLRSQMNRDAEDSQDVKWGFLPEGKADSSVSVLIIAQALDNLNKQNCKNIETDQSLEKKETENSFEEANVSSKTTEIVVELAPSQMLLDEENIAPAASSKVVPEPVSVNTEQRTNFSFDDSDALPLLEQNVDENDKTIPAVLRFASKKKQKKESEVFHQYEFGEFIRKN